MHPRTGARGGAGEPGSDGIFAQRFNSAGAPLGSEFQVNTYTTFGQRHAAVAADGTGNFLVAWDSPQDGDGRGIVGQRYDGAGTPSGGEFQVNAGTTGDQDYPALAVDGADNIVVVWTTFGEGVDGQRYDGAGAPLGSEFEVSDGGAFDRYPAVGAASTGDFLVVWRSNDFFGNGVFGRHFDGAGAPQGGEFRVNTYTTDSQSYAAVVGLGGGDFVVTWTSQDQDESDEGIFAQRLCTVSTCTNGDGCCPAACTFANDDDCPMPTMTSSVTVATTSTTSSSTLPTALIPGRIALIKQGSIAKFVAKPPTGGSFALPPLGQGPTVNGASLRLLDTGASAGDVTYMLAGGTPPYGWKGLGNPPGSKGYKYKGIGAGSPSDPCATVLLKERVIKAVCKGPGVTLTPPFTGDVGIVLTVTNATRYCAAFGGSELQNDGGGTRRKLAPAPAGCP